MPSYYDPTDPFLHQIDTQKFVAAQIVSPGTVSWKEVRFRKPARNEVCVRLEGCGLCASSIPLWEGREWFRYPLEPGAPGHESWGVVEQTGKGVSAIRQGDRVALLGYHSFAAYDYVAETDVIKLPPELDGIPFPGEPLGCALNIFERAAIQPGHTVAVVGAGFLGTLLIQLSKAAGARVIALSRRASSMAMAFEAGADEVIPLVNHEEGIGKVKVLTGGKFCDRVIECTGKELPLAVAAELCGVRARLVIAGYHQDGVRHINLQLWNWRGLDVINAHERDPGRYRNGIRNAVAAVVEGRIKPDMLYSHKYSLTALEEAMNTLAEAPEGFTKALLFY